MPSIPTRRRTGDRACRLTAFATVLLVSGLVAASASSSKFFQATTQIDFLKGDIENLSLDSQGRLSLGPTTDLVYETSSPFLWSILPGPDESDRKSTRLNSSHT